MSNNNIADVAICGLGPAGVFAAYKLSKEHKNIKIIAFDAGRPQGKRRRQLLGYLGCTPNSDGKLYLNDTDKVAELIGNKKAKAATTQVKNILENVSNLKIIKDKGPSQSILNKLKKNNYDLLLNDYIQMYPREIHALSKFTAESMEKNKNITFNFDEDVEKISKNKGIFTISTTTNEFKAKKIIIATGRSGWRWARDLFQSFGIIEDNDYARFGIRAEITSSYLKDFNKSNCTITKGGMEIGPFSWYGTVIPEDHVDLAISAFRSNEDRWKSDKVSFNMIGNYYTENFGFEQTDRIGKLMFLLANDRIIKEKISAILNGKAKISILPEYEWIKKDIMDLTQIIPEIASRAYYHVPTILPLAPKINLGNNFESEVPGMYVIGENTGLVGILSAMIMGTVVANGF